MKPRILKIVSVLLATLFLYTGVVKLINFNEFSLELKQSPILTRLPIHFLSLLPFAEILVAVILLVKRWRPIGILASFILMLAFTVYIFTLSQEQYYVPCDCGGVLDTLPIYLHLILNMFLLSLTILGIYLIWTQKHKDQINNDFAQKTSKAS